MHVILNFHSKRVYLDKNQGDRTQFLYSLYKENNPRGCFKLSSSTQVNKIFRPVNHY